MSNLLQQSMIAIVGGVIVLLIEYLIVQPIAKLTWFKLSLPKKLSRFLLALVLLIIPVLLLRDYLVQIISIIPVAEPTTRTGIYATVLALLAAMWGVVWDVYIRPQIFK